MATEEVKVSNKITNEILACPVKHVTVYLDRAEVCRSVDVQLKPGLNEVVIKKVTSAIDKDSVRVEGKGNATITDVSYNEQDVKKTEGDSDTVKVLRKKLEDLQKEKKQGENEQSRLLKQRSVLEGIAENISKGPTHADPQPASGGTNGPVSGGFLTQSGLEGVSKFLDFYGERAEKLDADLAKVTEKLQQLYEEIRVTTNNMHKASGGDRESLSREISIFLDSEKGGEAKLEITYVVFKASWVPSYDIRVFTDDGDLKVTYFGLIKQNTGEDWSDTHLALSTAVPSIGGNIPELGTQKVFFYKPPVLVKRAPTMRMEKISIKAGFRRGRPSAAVAPTADDVGADLFEEESEATPMDMAKAIAQRSEFWGVYATSEVQLPEDVDSVIMTRHAAPQMMMYCPTVFDAAGGGGAAAFRAGAPAPMMDMAPGAPPPPPPMQVAITEVKESAISTTFEIPRAATIPSDNTEHKVTVAIVDLKPEFSYETVPSKSAFAFLKAKVQNNSPYAFLSGPTSIFVDNNFIAKSTLKAVSPQEEFNCSLGVDPAIRVIYKPARKFHEQSGLISKYTHQTTEQVIELKNTRATEAKITVLEHLPLTTEEKIKVTLIEPVVTKEKEKNAVGGPFINKQNNLQWDLTLAPNEMKELKLKYKIEFPHGESLEFNEEKTG